MFEQAGPNTGKKVDIDSNLVKKKKLHNFIIKMISNCNLTQIYLYACSSLNMYIYWILAVAHSSKIWGYQWSHHCQK